MKFREETLSAPLPEDIQKLKWFGDFAAEKRVIEKRLNKDIPGRLKERLRAELEILEQMPGQYPYSWEEALQIMQENVQHFTPEEFQELWEEDAMDWIYVYGRVHFRDNFLSNLIKTREYLAERLKDKNLAADKQANAVFLNQTISYMKENHGISCRFHLRSTLRLKEGTRRNGEEIKVYLPVPVHYAQISSIQMVNARVMEKEGQERDIPIVPFLKQERDAEGDDTEFTAWLAPENAAQRTICFCGQYKEGMAFQVEYAYQVSMPYLNLYADVQPSPDAQENYPDKKNLHPPREKGSCSGWIPDKEEDLPKYYLGEQLPHIQFTPYLRALAAEIVGEETRPLQKARKIYDYITSHLMYSFVRNYFSITELVNYSASGWKGDCGLQALLLITLCRIEKIPARWQSGLYTGGSEAGSHDWAMVYLEPYGWLYADCSFGGSAYRMGCEERRQFYFGNIDPYRMPSCCQFQADFLPEFCGLRHDPYDNQCGEVAFSDRALRANEFETVHVVMDWERLE